MFDRREFLKTTLAASAALAAEVPAMAQAPLFPGFTAQKIQTSGATIHTLRGGSGPPLLLIHGYPQTHVEWHKIAPRLAPRFTVVMTDLRGYGDSSKPPDGDNHAATRSARWRRIKSRSCARWASRDSPSSATIAAPASRGDWRWSIPDVVTKAAIIDIVPLPYSRVTREFATSTFTGSS